MMEFKRNNDLENVFEQRYRANHGNNEIVQEKKKDFNRKMFNIRDKDDIRKEIRDANSVSGKVNSLNERMNAMNPNMSNVNSGFGNGNNNGYGSIKGFNNMGNNRF